MQRTVKLYQNDTCPYADCIHNAWRTCLHVCLLLHQDFYWLYIFKRCY